MNTIVKIVLTFLFFVVGLHSFSQSKKERVSPCIDTIFVPSTFTGSRDGINDIFRPFISGEPATYEFMIFNRWGELIFETKEPDKGWDGTYKDMAVKADTFVWKIEFTCPGSEKKYQYLGHVELVR